MQNTRHNHLFVLAAILVAPVAGCDYELAESGALRQAISCPMDECGGNSAELVTGLFTGELNLYQGQNAGAENSKGAQISGFIAPGGATDFILQVEQGQLSASNGSTTLTGTDLIGGRIRITDTADGSVAELIIHNHGTVQAWTQPSFAVDRYVFKTWYPDLETYVPVCTDAVDLQEDAAWSVLVSGELYSWGDKVMLETGVSAAGWFNLVCSGNGLYKMKMMGYDPNPTSANPFTTVWQERQATLKMITADYCGTGTSHTEDGTPLYWRNADNWSFNNVPASSTIEARWDENGARCLSTPRLGASEMAAIQADCASVGKTLPLCDGPTGPYEWRSLLPL